MKINLIKTIEINNRTIQKYFARNILEGSNLLEIFIVNAIGAILVTRTILELSGYPKIGGNNLHIAHMLFGGFFMLVAIVLLLVFVTRSSRYIGAYFGGIGFGLFIDELGKFITADNNYFFQPTIALIYIIFLSIFLFFKILQSKIKYTQDEYFINAIEQLKEVGIKDLDEREKQRMFEMLSRSDQTNLFVQKFQEIVRKVPANRQKIEIGLYERYRERFLNLYYRIIRKQWFNNLFVYLILLKMILLLMIILSIFYKLYESLRSPSLIETLEIIFSSVCLFLIAIGLKQWRKNSETSLNQLKVAVLYSLFFVQVLVFYREEVSAVFGFFFDLSLLGAFNYMLKQGRYRTNFDSN